MRNKLAILLILMPILVLQAQIDANSLFGLPTATNTEMNGITGASSGQCLFNTDENAIFCFNGSIWVQANDDQQLNDTSTAFTSGTNTLTIALENGGSATADLSALYQNAANVPIEDSANNFTADNVEDALTELLSANQNLATANLTQAAETRAYDMNGQDLNFTNGSFGIGTTNPVGILEARNAIDQDGFLFVQENGTSAEKDVFTILDEDDSGGGQDEGSTFKVYKSGSINSSANGYSLIELTSIGPDPGDNKYWISGRNVDEGAPLWGVDITDNDFWSEGGIVLGVTGADGGTYSGGNFSVSNAGQITSNNLAGTGTRMVVADNTGVLSTQALPSGDNIYNADGTLTANRNITQGSNDLNFDANTFVISGDNNRVGIGTNDPQRALHVAAANDQVRFSRGNNTAGLIIDRYDGTINNTLASTVFGLNSSTAGTGEFYFANYNENISGGSFTRWMTFDIDTNKLTFNQLGSGTYTGTAASVLAVEADGDVIEVDPTSLSTNLYNTDGALTADRNVTFGANDLNFDANTLVVDGANNSVGVGTASPAGTFEIYEATGTVANAGRGSLTLTHGDAGGTSSIVFRSAVNLLSDSGYIQFSDDGSGNGSTTENGLLEIGTTNDVPGAFQDDIALMPSGYVGVKTNTPTAVMDINGNARIRTLNAAADTDQLVTADSDGNLSKVNSLKASKVFYPPSIAIDASTNGTGLTLNLYQEYIDQFGSGNTSLIRSVDGAVTAPDIPVYSANELYYYVTYFDPLVFANLSIDGATGELTYDVIGQPADFNSLINVVFVVK